MKIILSFFNKKVFNKYMDILENVINIIKNKLIVNLYI